MERKTNVLDLKRVRGKKKKEKKGIKTQKEKKIDVLDLRSRGIFEDKRV